MAIVVGGSITIPHLRRAIERVDEALEQKQPPSGDLQAEAQSLTWHSHTLLFAKALTNSSAL